MRPLQEEPIAVSSQSPCENGSLAVGETLAGGVHALREGEGHCMSLFESSQRALHAPLRYSQMSSPGAVYAHPVFRAESGANDPQPWGGRTAHGAAYPTSS